MPRKTSITDFLEMYSPIVAHVWPLADVSGSWRDALVRFDGHCCVSDFIRADHGACRVQRACQGFGSVLP